MAHRLEGVRRDLRRLTWQKRIVRGIYFPLNIFPTQEFLELFGFQQRELSTMGKVMPWRGLTKRQRYCWSLLLATCIITRRLSIPIRWFELEFLFGMSSQALSEIFLQLHHDCKTMYETLFGSLWMNLLQNWARMYVDCISESGTPLPNCFRFMNGTKLFLSRSGGTNANQLSCYTRQERRHFHFYLTITTPDGLILYL